MSHQGTNDGTANSCDRSSGKSENTVAKQESVNNSSRSSNIGSSAQPDRYQQMGGLFLLPKNLSLQHFLPAHAGNRPWNERSGNSTDLAAASTAERETSQAQNAVFGNAAAVQSFPVPPSSGQQQRAFSDPGSKICGGREHSW
ncbi:hypothetical protein CLOP_g10251 [Closterium sp. NIES-67]|nr:hypothetical protein CLOP_g10251 [Closterium sp. NIES-67]